MNDHPVPDPLTLRIGHHELFVRRRYEAASIVNDLLIALWFIAGSLLFFSTELTTAGTWCFLLGSIELLIRPMIRLVRQLHLKRLQAPDQAAATESGQDF